MYNPHQTKRGVMIANFSVAIIIMLFTLFLILTGCVSAKKYNRLEKAYQKAGFKIREFEQENKILRIDSEDLRTLKGDTIKK